MDARYYPSPGARIGIFWDYENYSPPSTLNGCDTANRIRRLGQHFGSVVAFKAYFDQSVTPCTKQMRSQLQSSGVSLTDCPRPDSTRKDVADKMILADMMAFAFDNPLPSAIILISGDRDFAYAISVLRAQLHPVILVHHRNSANLNLITQPSIVIEGERIFGSGWEDTLAQLPALFDHKKPAPPLPAIEASTIHPQEDAPSAQQEKESVGPTTTDVVPNELGETTNSVARSTPVTPELEPRDDISYSARGGLESQSDDGHSIDPIAVPIPSTAPAVAATVDDASSLGDGPPPIPPRPSGHPSAKIVRARPLVDYPESVSEASEEEDDNIQAAQAEMTEDGVLLPLDVGSLPADIQTVPALTSPTSTSAASSSLKDIPEVFADLVDILDQARCMGIEHLNLETVEQMVLHRNPDVLVETKTQRFGRYLKLAHDQGIVEYSGGRQGVRLKEEVW